MAKHEESVVLLHGAPGRPHPFSVAEYHIEDFVHVTCCKLKVDRQACAAKRVPSGQMLE